ncbi:MAG: aminotransferase class IV [Nitrospira sp.]
MIALTRSIDAGADEALMLDIHGFVSTCNATNFFMVKAGEVWTSTGEYFINGTLAGKNYCDCCKANGIPVYQKNFSLHRCLRCRRSLCRGRSRGWFPSTSMGA